MATGPSGVLCRLSNWLEVHRQSVKTEIRLAMSDYSRAESQTVSTHPPGGGGGGGGMMLFEVELYNNEVDL